MCCGYWPHFSPQPVAICVFALGTKCQRGARGVVKYRSEIPRSLERRADAPAMFLTMGIHPLGAEELLVSVWRLGIDSSQSFSFLALWGQEILEHPGKNL